MNGQKPWIFQPNLTRIAEISKMSNDLGLVDGSEAIADLKSLVKKNLTNLGLLKRLVDGCRRENKV